MNPPSLFDKKPQLNFDETWYLAKYPDVSKAVLQGNVESGLVHYLRHGRAESRYPNKIAANYRKIFTYGSYGSNNVGDEAILEGLRRQYPGCLQIYMNRRRDGEGVYPHEILQSRRFFERGDLLVIGGGGLLYDKNTVSVMADIAAKAINEEASVEILGLGCEAAHHSYHTEIRRLFSYASKVSLRSSKSQKIMEEITGKRYPIGPDLAFNLAYEARIEPGQRSDLLCVGVVTASSNLRDIGDALSLASLIRTYSQRDQDPVRFCHIPHSKSYFNAENNDCITGEVLWSLSEVHKAKIDGPFVNLAYENDPLRCIRTYRQLDGVVSSRYHGLVFGAIAGIPTLALGEELPKIASFLEDRKDVVTLVAAKNGRELNEKFEKFLKIVSAGRTKACKPPA